MDKRLSLGINASIILILIIFCALLSLPLKLLFNTNYEGSDNDTQPPLVKEENKKNILPSLKVKDFSKIKVCPFNYENWMKSQFVTYYDKNCTKRQLIQKRLIEKQPQPVAEEEEKLVLLDPDQNGSEIIPSSMQLKKKQAEVPGNKSIPVAVHILAIMLVVSVIAALVEVLRIRFSREKDTSSSGGNVNSRRRSSINNFEAQKKCMTQEILKSQRSLDLPNMHRSTRVLGVKPSLLRRSSFPAHVSTKMIQTSSGFSILNRPLRRPSTELEDEMSGLIIGLHHRSHLIRRH